MHDLTMHDVLVRRGFHPAALSIGPMGRNGTAGPLEPKAGISARDAVAAGDCRSRKN
jgi:hypothetical protein